MASSVPAPPTSPPDAGPSTPTPPKRTVVRISAAARQLLLDHFNNISTHPSRDARTTLAENVSRLDDIQYTVDQVNNWFANRRTNISRSTVDRSDSTTVAPVNTHNLDKDVRQVLDTLFARTPNVSDRDIGRWCNDLQIPFLHGLRYIDQKRARHCSDLQATSLPTPASTASPEVRSRELPSLEIIKEEPKQEPEAPVTVKLPERHTIACCSWLDELAARPMPVNRSETVEYAQPRFAPSNITELDESLQEFRAALARLRDKLPDQDVIMGDSG